MNNIYSVIHSFKHQNSTIISLFIHSQREGKTAFEKNSIDADVIAIFKA